MVWLMGSKFVALIMLLIALKLYKSPKEEEVKHDINNDMDKINPVFLISNSDSCSPEAIDELCTKL